MKKFVRLFLLVESFVFFLVFIKDLEELTNYNPVFGNVHTPESWIWFWVAEGIPMVAMLAAALYSFWNTGKNRYILAVSAVLYGVFLMVSEFVRMHTRYVSVPPVVTAMVLAVFLVCVFFRRIPNRRKIAAGAMAVLAVGLVAAHLISGGFDNLVDWGFLYVPPVLAYSLLGYTLPDK